MKKKTESGQAIVLLVFAVVGLIGFTALAIDGGMLFSDRRHAQSASDAASLAGGAFAALALENYHIEKAEFDCDMWDLDHNQTDPNTLVNKARTVALNRAYSNDYTNAQVTVTAFCEDNGPVFDEKYLEFTTDIVKETNTSLIHLVYDGPAVNQVEATVRVRPRSPGASGNAIVALNESDCDGNQNGVILGGSSTTLVDGGGIFSNGCLKCNGSGTSHEVKVTNGEIFFVLQSKGCGEDELDPPAESFPNPLDEDLWNIPEPDCSGLPNHSMGDFDEDEEGWVNLEPGVYNKISDGGIDKIRFLPGLYCVTGSPNAIKISTAQFEGIYVTFFVTTGGVQITGTGDEDNPSILRAPRQNDDVAPAIEGVLIYMAHGNVSEIKLTGNSATAFSGTVYSPDGDIVATGTGDAAGFGTQLVGQNVEVAGTAFIDINFNDDDVREVPAWIDLTE
jgi:hypothetical protein